MGRTGKTFSSALGLLLAAGIVIFGNIVANRLGLRRDMTDEKLYTLSQGTRNILKHLETPVTLRFCYSRSLRDTPPQFKNYAKRVEDLLREYPALSGGKLSLIMSDPEPDSEEEDVAQRSGLQGLPIAPEVHFYLGLMASGSGGEEVIPYFDQSRERFLEYDITRAIYLASQEGRVKVGVLSSLKLFGDPAPNPMFGGPPPEQNGKPWMFIEELKKLYDVSEIPASAERIEDSVRLLVVIQPKDLQEKTQYAIDQFVMSGRNAIFFVDPAYTNEEQRQQFGPQSDTSLDHLFKAWGVEYSAEKIVVDSELATLVRTHKGPMKHPAWLSLGEANMSKDEVISAQLSTVLMVHAGSLGKVEGVDVTMVPLITSSKESKSLDKFKVSYGSPSSLLTELQSGTDTHVLAALYKGKLKSAFAAPPAGASGTPVKEAASTIAVVADVDMLVDAYCLRPIEIMGQVYGYQPLNQNVIFLNNSVEMLTGNQDLISLRSRGRFTRPFDKVLDIEARARKEWQTKVDEREKRLKDIEEEIGKHLKMGGDGQAIMTAEIQEQLEKARSESTRIRHELRALRRQLNGDVDTLGAWLKFWNIAAVPLFIGLCGIVVASTRSNRLRKQEG